MTDVEGATPAALFRLPPALGKDRIRRTITELSDSSEHGRPSAPADSPNQRLDRWLLSPSPLGTPFALEAPEAPQG
jgi:hypothetical protein